MFFLWLKYSNISANCTLQLVTKKLHNVTIDILRTRRSWQTWARWEKKTKVFTSYFLHFCRRVSFKYVKYSHSPRQQNYQKIYSKNFYEPKNACFETDSRRNRSRILYRIREDFNKEYVRNRLFSLAWRQSAYLLRRIWDYKRANTFCAYYVSHCDRHCFLILPRSRPGAFFCHKTEVTV